MRRPNVLIVPLALLTFACGRTEPDDVKNRSFEDFKADVFQEPDSGVYIVDGDTPVVGDDALEALFFGESLEGVAWQRGVRYCVSRSAFGSEYATVVDALAAAAAPWGQAGVALEHVAALDDVCDAGTGGVTFHVDRVAYGEYLARAYAPAFPRELRALRIDDVALGGDVDLTAALDRALVHALGPHGQHESQTLR